jgi:hypothetical protein
MILNIQVNSFKTLNIEGIDISTFSFYGSTDGYDYNDAKSSNTIGFSLLDDSKVEETVKIITEKFNLNKESTKVEDYVSIGHIYGETRPRIRIKFTNGYKGMTSPPNFSFRAG